MVSNGDSAAAIVPDGKDWTWVLLRVCPECGFNAATFPAADVSTLILRVGTAWRVLLAAQPLEELRRRPALGRWSALEYACHVRDVLRIYDERLLRMLTEDNPRYLNWDQDLTAVEERYRAQDPAQVATDLATAAARIGTRFATIGEDQWARTGERSDGARFTIDSFARYFVHDPVHHLYDVNGLPGGGLAPAEFF